MKIEIKEIYKCDHCNKLYQIKRHAEHHEKMCFKNPDNERPCFNCDYLKKESVKIYTGIDDYYSSEPVNKEMDFFYCESKKHFIYTPQNGVKGNHNHIDEGGNNLINLPMPNECEEFNKELNNSELDDFFK